MLPVLTPLELRVLGSLIEKSRTTPDYYPMTLNALTAACNQKTSRWPVTDYSEEDIQQGLNSLKGQSLVATAVGGGSRTVKYKHNFGTVYDVSDAAIAVLCLLMLRGPQTAGELNSNAGRLYEFRDLAEVNAVLHELSQASPAFVIELQRRPGQKENRFMHLLGGDVHEEQMQEIAEASPVLSFEHRLTALEAEVAGLRGQVQKLLQELGS